MKTYIIKYDIIFYNGIKDRHTIRVKNCMNDLFAKLKLEKWLRSKKQFHRIEIISCQQDFFGINDLFDIFKK